MKEGKIVKALSGFYYVQSEDNLYACKGRGVFRKRKINPLVGDLVTFDVTDEAEGYITEVKERNNVFKRPPIANIDQAIVVSSAKTPSFSPLLLDRFLVVFEAKHITPVIFITKVDLISKEEKEALNYYKQVYEDIGYTVELVIASDNSDLTYLKPYLSQKISVITGQSGVGKSSILNAMDASLLIETAEISSSLGRGKHTTRHVELLSIGNGLIADTPGFSAVDMEEIEQEDLGDCFPEMNERKKDCKFRGCLHLKEPHCAIKKAVDEDAIAQHRYDSYLHFLKEIQERKVRY